MKVNTQLIVLHTTRYGENSVILHTLGREYGRRSFFVRNASKKQMMTLFQPLNVLEGDVSDDGKARLLNIRNLSAVYPLSGIRADLYKNSMTLFISEVLYRAVKEGSREEGMFEWCVKNILLLDSVSTDFSNFHLRFLLELSVILGFSPSIEDLRPFVGSHYGIISEFMASSFAESMLIPLSGEIRNEIAEDILRYLEFHLDSSLNINSLKVLRELYA